MSILPSIYIILLPIITLGLILIFFPGRTKTKLRGCTDYKNRVLSRLQSYQQLIAGILAIFAGIAVIYAAVLQIEHKEKLTMKNNLTGELGITRVLIADVDNLIRFLDEFDNKFKQNIDDRDNIGYLPYLTQNTYIYSALVQDLKKLPPSLSTKVIFLYAVYNDNYKPMMKQKFKFTSEDYKNVKKYITGEFRPICEETKEKLKEHADKLQDKLESLN